MIEFEIPMRTPLLNVWQRMHWAKRKRLAAEMAKAISICLPKWKRPGKPIKKCQVTVLRESTKRPDRDGLYGGLKPLLDILQPPSKRHPLGLGIISNDNDDCIVSLTAEHVAGKGQRTKVTINELS